MLFEISIGDAYGMGYEFAGEEALASRVNDGVTYHPHPFHPIKPGNYTDDTQMSLAVAEVILDKGEKATREDFAEAFVQAFRRDPRLGYSSGFHALLTQVTSGAELIAALRPASKGAGSAMRACPIGVLADLEDVLRIAEIQARITHDTPEGVAAAQGVAAMTHFGVVSGPDALPGLRKRLRDLDPLLDRALSRKHTGRVPNEGLPALNAALGVIEVSQTMKDAAILSVEVGGDVDTVAAVAMGVLSLMLPEALTKVPSELVHRSACGPYGLGYIRSLDAELEERMAIARSRSLDAAKL